MALSESGPVSQGNLGMIGYLVFQSRRCMVLVTHEWKSTAESGEGKSQTAMKKVIVEAEARTRLRQSAYSAVRPVSCEYYEGVLTLHGHVATYYLKQIAQALIRGMEGVEEVNNRLTVSPPPEHA